MRNTFLSQWRPYPAVDNPQDYNDFGQLILFIESESLIKLQNSSGAKTLKVSKTAKLKNWDGQIYSVLNPGDKLALKFNAQHEVEELTLLAPNLTSDYKSVSSSIVGWYEFLQSVRSFFLKQSFLETPTPSLVINPGMEPHLQAFQTKWNFGSKEKQVYLPTSPEIHLKKLLSQGLSQIFEIKTCYRNEESSPLHRPEFTMLEWYRAYSSLDLIERDIQNLLTKVTQQSVSLQKLHLKDIYESHFKANWAEVFNFEVFKSRAKEAGFSGENLTWNDLFSWFQVAVVEPELMQMSDPVILYGFPDLQPSLARSQNGESERFELYWRGVELANAYHELNDPKIQRQRWLQDQAERKQNDLEVYDLDEEFLLSLEQGLPPSAGIALGLERLYMVIQEIKDIKELCPFKGLED